MNNIDWSKERNKLILEKMKMDKFFSNFLDKFERKMDPDKPNTPIWKLYKAKMNEYSELDRKLKTAEYWLSKGRRV